MILSALLVMATLQVHPVAEIDSIVTSGITRGVYPGAVAVIGTADTTLFIRGFGRFTWQPDASPADPDSTLYDLASLTKVIATTAAIMRLVDTERLTLDTPVSAHVADFVGEGKPDVTVRHLLAHSSGLRAFLPLNERAASPEEARGLVVTEALRRAPGARAEYSDLNAMLLAWVVEGVTGLPFDEFVRDSVHRPLGMTQTRFRLPRSLHHRAAPINRWRGHPIAGVVHDQNAEVLGGVAGHAGLYSTGRDMARFSRMVLARGQADPGERFVSEATVAEFLSRQPGNRALGFEANDTTSSGHTGDSLSAEAVGHGGYTGSSIWIDPGQNIFVVLLTNRVFAPRTGRSISELREIRGKFADAAVRLRHYYCRVLADGPERAAVGCRSPAPH